MGDHQPSHRARNLGRLKYPVEDNEVTLYRPGITIREKVIVPQPRGRIRNNDPEKRICQ
jgi:hypothetical protein